MTDDTGFENWASPDVAANYRRLRSSERVAPVISKLARHGLNDWETEILFRNLAAIPQDWQSENEPWSQAVKRRKRLAKNLRSLAAEVKTDPDLSRLSFQVTMTGYGTPSSSEADDNMQPFSGLLENAASFLEPGEKGLIRTNNGATLTEREFDRRFRPERKPALRSYALRVIFELLQPHFGRAPNTETECIASVLLGKPIKAGTVTQLRKKQRRQYAREKQ